MKGFGERLVAARAKKNLSQKKLAELLNITPTRLNYWEKDKREPDFEMFVKILELLEADANDLLGLSVKITNRDTDENTRLYNALDIEDKAEIRGEMKQMLRAEKYHQDEVSASVRMA